MKYNTFISQHELKCRTCKKTYPFSESEALNHIDHKLRVRMKLKPALLDIFLSNIPFITLAVISVYAINEMLKVIQRLSGVVTF